MAKDYEKVELVREIEQKMDSTLRTVSGEVIAEDIEGYLDSLSAASGGVNPADDGAESAGILRNVRSVRTYGAGMGK